VWIFLANFVVVRSRVGADVIRNISFSIVVVVVVAAVVSTIPE
jgi:hypothetical protein